ncbi:MAG: 7-cyano-7-deazaguanine synthase, partial [Candidatus Hydrogenedentes bacterium]|nr:7-cyano-7-deazaguanine synthase [Candidatus Hydrogenedentota bacterium]
MSANSETERPLAIVVASGGLDSCVTAAIGNEKYDLAFLHLNYGHRTEARELEAFHAIADYYEVKQRLVADIDHLRKIGGSSLTDRNMPVSED